MKLRFSKELMKIPPQVIQTIVDVKTLMKAKKNEDSSIFFHGEDKGCILVPTAVFSKYARRVIPVKYCETHHVHICRCGWEFTEHYGTHSRELTAMDRKDWGGRPEKVVERECFKCGKMHVCRRENTKYCPDCREIVHKEQLARNNQIRKERENAMVISKNQKETIPGGTSEKDPRGTQGVLSS